ncbi:hypothetical protein [Embleya sp. NPDC059237]|uniref:hypothetical protein n=1 Tax=Embleya sp. NPDC059237 TaxID=3346784 RepID=UPI0036C6A2AE
MAEHHVLRTHIGGALVDLPGTIGEIRAGLPEDRRAAFDAAIDATPLHLVPAVAARWGLPAEAVAEDEEAFRRLESGDYSGVVYADDLPDWQGEA